MQTSRRPPKEDPNGTGVTFVDLLFALVVGKLLDVGFSGPISTTDTAHLIVGAVLTVTSWVGYHNSVNRSAYFLRFWNLPLWLFLIDVLLVLDYWLIPSKAVGQVEPDARMITWIVAIAAGLYVVWDLVALGVRRSPEYLERPHDRDIPRRRHVSIVFFVAMCGMGVAVQVWNPHTTCKVVGIDFLLVVLLLTYRWLKELVTPADALAPQIHPDVGESRE